MLCNMYPKVGNNPHLQVAVEDNLQKLIEMAILAVTLELCDGGGLKQVKLEQVRAPDELNHSLCSCVLH